MTGIEDTDIKLADSFQLTAAANGDAPLCSGYDCLYQNIVIEAVTQKGDLFYDTDFGWSLYDFIQSEDDELTRLEIEQRVVLGLQKREVIVQDSISASVSFSDGVFQIKCAFRFQGEAETRDLTVIIGAVNVEVINSD